MKKTFTKFLAALALLAFFIPSMIAVGQTTYKLEQVTSVEVGSLYVFEQDGHVMNNNISSSALQTTNSYSTTGLAGTETYIWTLETATNGFYMKNVSLSSNAYLNNGSGTGVSLGNKSSNWAFNFQTDNTVLIQNNSNSNRFLGYTTSSSYAYKAYATSNLSSYPHAIKVYKLVEEGGSSTTPTTVTIDATGITNTDVYTGTAAGSLSATVKDNNNNPISGATVTWTSSDTSVATINASGVVTLVAAGTTTITASYAGDSTYGSSSNTYELTVTDSTPMGDLVIDFESATGAYTNWTFTEMTSQGSGSITAHGGTNYGTTGGKTTASITTRSKIATPYTLTCYVSKQTNNTTSSTWYIQVSSDGSTWTEVASRSATDMSKGEWKEFTAELTAYTNVYVRVSYSGSTAIRNIDDLTLITTIPSVIAPTFSPVEGLYSSAQNVTISTTTSGATIYYTLDGTDPTTSSNVYSTAIPVGSTTTIKAIAVSSGNASSIVSATYTIVGHAGTQADPYTVADARAAIDAGMGVTGVYATGIVCTASPQLYNNKYLSYYISADGETTSDQLEAYNGLNNGGAAFTSVDDVEVGATVVIYGDLTKHNDTYEFAANNQLVEYTAPQHDVEAPTFSPVAGTYTSEQTVSMSTTTSGATIYYTLDGTEPTNASTQYTTALTVSTATTIKAVAYDGTNYSNVTTANYHFCSTDDPYTVTEALAFLDYPAQGIYVTGIVSTAPTSLSSGTLTYFISVDGEATNELEVYKGKGLDNEAFTAVDDIQVGDIVTIYGNVVIYGTSNPVKEFAQGNYLVSFERPAVPYDLTVSALNSNVNGIFVFNANGQTEPLIADGAAGTVQVTSGTSIMVSPDIADGYVLETLTVDGDNVTSQVTGGEYTFTMPTHAVTISATAKEAPTPTTYTLATSIVSGKTYIITNGSDRAMGAQNSNNRAAVEITIAGSTTTIETADVYEFVISTDETDNSLFNIYDAVNDGYLYAAGGTSSNYLRTKSDIDATGQWNISIDSEGIASIVANFDGSKADPRNTMRYNSNNDIFSCYASGQDDIYLYEKDEVPTTATYYYSVNGTLSQEYTCAIGSTKTLETGTDLYSNFTFAGWTTAAHDVSSPISSYTFADQGPVTFYAVYAHNSNYYTRVFNETATSDIIIYGPAIIPSFATLDMGVYNLDYYMAPLVNIPYILIEEGGQMIYHDDIIKMVIQKNINAPTGTWGEDDNTGWYTFSSPNGYWSKLSEYEDFTLPAVGGVRQYDLYAYAENFGWYNKKDGSYINCIDEGVGYLYARAQSIMFNLSGESYNDDVDLTNLSYTSRMGALAGLHCIGNPYTHNIYKGVGITGDMAANYYALNEATGAWISTTDATPITPMHAILVFVNKTDGTAAIHMTSDNSAPSSKANNDYIKFTVANNQYEDVAYAWFDKGEGLKKINHRNSEVPMLYIPQYNTNYSIAYMSDNTDMFNLNFKAMTTGKYTLSVSEKGDFSYLHIYDRLTGEDVDMLNDDYSFIGAPSDNEARFIVRLSYSAGNGSDINTFAFQNGSDIIVNGEGELQIFDVMGRMVKNTVINGVETIAMPQGVYIFRLNENIQKIVVR